MSQDPIISPYRGYIYPQRNMFKPKSESERQLHRLKIARGHLNKVIQMVESGDYCIDVLHQSQAVQHALKETDNIILENHLKTCTADAIKENRIDSAIREIMEVVKKTK